MVIFCFIRLFFGIVLKEFLLKGDSNVHFLSGQVRIVLFSIRREFAFPVLPRDTIIKDLPVEKVDLLHNDN
jgi:hypothetical protein